MVLYHVPERASLVVEISAPLDADRLYTKALPLYEEVRRVSPSARSERGVLLVLQRLGDAKVMLGDLRCLED